MNNNLSQRMARLPVDTLVRLGAYGLVLYFALSVVLPFLWIGIWSVILTVMMYPIFHWLRVMTGGAERLAAVVVTSVTLVLVLGPVALLCSSLVASLRQILAGVVGGNFAFPLVPDVIASLPVIGATLADTWTLGGSNFVEFLETHAHTLVVPGEWLLSLIAGLAGVVLTLAVAVVLAGLMFIPSRRAVEVVNAATERIAGPQGTRIVGIATQTIRCVGRGVVGISLLQALCLGAVLVLAEVPHPGLLTFLALVFAIVQIGAIYIAVPVTVWVWFMRDPTDAILFTAAVVVISTLEHILKPIVMGRGLKTPTLLLFFGLFGGVAVYGIAGIFIGPVVLSVCWEVLTSWFADTPAPPAIAPVAAPEPVPDPLATRGLAGGPAGSDA
jgi:predicted PurR-regulated permease PerM